MGLEIVDKKKVKRNMEPHADPKFLPILSVYIRVLKPK